MFRKHVGPRLIGLSVVGVVALWSTSLFALQPKTVWIETYGTGGNEYGYSVDHTSDGGYIVVGTKEPPIGISRDYYLVKTDAGGDTVWTRTYGGIRDDVGMSVQQTSDGGYIVGGWSFAPGAAAADARLVKIAANGDSVWTGEYGGAGADAANSVQQTSDGGYIFTGATSSFGASDGDVYVVKTDASGDTAWTRLIGGSGYDMGTSVRQTSDNGYVIAGGTFSYGAGGDVYLIRMNATGDTVWTRTFGSTDWEIGRSVQETSDGGYIIAGTTDSLGYESEDVYLIKTDDQGHAAWTSLLGGAGEQFGSSVDQTSDGGYIIAGYAADSGISEGIYVVRADSSGAEIWSEVYGGAFGDAGYSVQETSAGKYIVAGSATSFGADINDMFLMRLKDSKWKAKDKKLPLPPTPGPGNGDLVVAFSNDVPARLALHGSTPNPCSQGTVIRFHLPEQGEVDLSILDAEGRLVRELVSEVRSAGSHSVVWDGRLFSGAEVPPGIYFLHLESQGKVATGKIVIAH
jgi:hypothetical protein